MRTRLLTLALPVCLGLGAACERRDEVMAVDIETKNVEITTPRGAKLEARLSHPSTVEAPLPAVVLAPGVGYDMDKPLMQRTAERLAERGFLALRFNWDFYSNRTQRAPALRNEIEDLQAALAYLREDRRVDRKRIFLVGKSLGSLTAIEVASADTELAGLVILTFAMHDQGKPEAVRPVALKIVQLKLPIFVVGGDNDPLCNTDALDRLLSECGPKPDSFIVPGNHTIETDSPETTEQSIGRCVKAVADWLEERARRPG
ncbi:MAG: dienelactone hydrolase family protein [Phycisphaerales bacterium]|nr:MAG: dienelactone hydrolase family protein [Phycisphaerales bacterium]